MSEILKPLIGFTDQEHAYLVDDYPYGFHLRCKIRYWLEYKSGQGFRLCSQTTNPKKKVSLEGNPDIPFWNKPKKSTYCDLAVMGLNSENHVTWQGVHVYNQEELTEFLSSYESGFDNNQNCVATAMKLAIARYAKAKYTFTSTITEYVPKTD